jgi:CubicO group peptidase (beta-lactamase class C family)
MRIFFTILAVFLLANAVQAQINRPTAPDKRLIGLDTALSKLLKDWHAAGFAVAVVEKDKIVYSKGFGYRDYEKKLPVTSNTLFAIGSCTKAFTASLLGILEKQERLKLDDKVTDVLPGFHFFNKEMDNTLTLRDLMTHRTGMPRHDLSWYLFNTSSRDSLIKRIRYQEPSAGIREKWQYNNFMFLLQGVVSEKLWGRTWEENIRTQLLDPLGMQRTNTDIHLMGPAGSINSSVDEMAKWLMLWIQGGKFGGKEILPPGYVNQAMGSQMVISTGLPDRQNPDVHLANYGLGWFINSYRGHYRVEHGGNIDGFTASACFFPSDSIGIVVLSNQNASNIPSLARNIIADRMLRLSNINWNGIRKKASDEAAAQEKKNKPQPANHPGTHPSHAASAYAGSYTNAGYGTIHVTNRGDSLFTYFANDSAWLKHYHYDVFSLVGYDKDTHQIDTTDDESLRFTFQFGENGEMQSFFVPVEGSLKPIEFTYKPAARKVTADEMAKYVGEYELGNMTVQVTVLNSVLHVFVPGQKNYPTEAIGDHRFALKDLEGFSIVFKLNEKGEPVSVDFVQPNGIFTATKKKK